jgi:hypothetical protein
MQPFLASALDGDEWSDSRPGRFTPGERVPETHWIGGWVGLRTALDVVDYGKSLASAGNRTLAVQPVAIPIDLSRQVLVLKQAFRLCSDHSVEYLSIISKFMFESPYA